MNNPITKTTTKRLLHMAAAALVLFVMLLGVSALMAQGQRVTKRAACKDWFDHLSEQDRTSVATAFETAMNKSAIDSPEGKRLREKLLDARDCYKSPKAVVQDILTKDMHTTIVLPKESLVMFYEPESPSLAPRPESFRGWYANEHCLHIFYLPEIGHPTAERATFKNNIMCCYEPW